VTRNIRKQRGYRAERAVCDYLGIERIAGVGRRDGDGDWFSVEVKSRQKVAGYLTDGMEQSERLSRPDQLAIVVLHETGWRHDDDLVVMRLSEFRDRVVPAVEEKYRVIECEYRVIEEGEQ